MFCVAGDVVASDDSSYVTGHDMLVDGGLTSAYVVSTRHISKSMGPRAEKSRWRDDRPPRDPCSCLLLSA